MKITEDLSCQKRKASYLSGIFLAAQRKECGELLHVLGGIFLGIQWLMLLTSTDMLTSSLLPIRGRQYIILSHMRELSLVFCISIVYDVYGM